MCSKSEFSEFDCHETNRLYTVCPLLLTPFGTIENFREEFTICGKGVRGVKDFIQGVGVD